MARVAFIFPGQGAQKVGMGQALCEEDERARSVFEQADVALGFSIRELCFKGPEERLRETAITQPAILTASIAAARCLDAEPDVVAGHSLGEYSANVFSRTMEFADAVRIVHARGQYMQEAVPLGEGAMAAVMTKERSLVEATCSNTQGVVEPVNYNSPGQIVIAGAAVAVKAAGDTLREAGAKVVPLSVSAPFHSSLMKPAEERLEPHLRDTEFQNPAMPIYTNVDAIAVESAESAREALIRQVSRPVRWEPIVRRMLEDGVCLFVEIGPGRVLSGLLARIDKSAKRANVSGPADIAPAREAIAAVRG